MNFHDIFLAVAILGGTGLFFAVMLAIADRKLRVWEDPRLVEVAAMLPQANCGACGSVGCHNFAERLVAGEAKPSLCTVLGGDGVADVAEFLGVDAGTAVKRVARLLCAGGTDVAIQQASYAGFATCAAAAAVAGGGKRCAWGCIGLGDCATACTFDAIQMSEHRLPIVSLDACTACNDCVEACPKDLFTILPVTQTLLVQCRSLLEGDEAVALCQAACNACGRCALDAAPGLIRMENGLPVINPAKMDLAHPKATERCPTGAIVWLEGQQFASSGADVKWSGAV